MNKSPHQLFPARHLPLPPAVAHILQQGDMYGEGESPIKPEQLTTEVRAHVHGCPSVL